MTRILARIFFSICLIHISFSSGGVSYAYAKKTENPKNPPSSLALKVVDDIELSREELEQQELKQRQVLSALFQLNKKIKKIVVDKAEYSQRTAFLEVNIRNTERRIEDIEKGISAQRGLLAERLRALYKLNSSSMAKFLFTSISPNDLDRNLKILGIVTEHDALLLKNYVTDVNKVKNQRQKLVKDLEKLKEVAVNIEREEKKLRKEQILKKSILEGIRKKKLFTREKISKLREMSLALNISDNSVLDLIFKPSFFENQGALTRPVSGRVLTKFGLIKDDQHPYTLFNKGVHFSAKAGEKVRSVFGGTVTFAEHIDRVGSTVIVDHGDHYYTVYSNLSKALVAVGSEVFQGQEIGELSGRGGSKQSSTLYFELRHFSEPYDPTMWMKGL